MRNACAVFHRQYLHVVVQPVHRPRHHRHHTATTATTPTTPIADAIITATAIVSAAATVTSSYQQRRAQVVSEPDSSLERRRQHRLTLPCACADCCRWHGASASHHPPLATRNALRRTHT